MVTPREQRQLAAGLAMIIAIAASSSSTLAATLYWSGNGTSQGGSGTWNTSLARFGTVGGGPYTTVWNNTTNAADTALFGGSNATATLGADITVRQLTFNNASTVAGGGFSLTTGATNSLTIAAGGSGRTTGGTVSAPIVGSGGLTISNTAGPIVLTGSSTYSGTTVIGVAISGVPIRLTLGNGGASGSIGSSSGMRIDAGSIFQTSRNDTITQGVNFPLITGGGSFIKGGVGTTIFTLTNSYSGSTSIVNGTLQLGDGGTTGGIGQSSAITVASGATFAVNRSNNTNQASSGAGFRAIDGAGGFTQAGSGTTTLAVTNSYTGPTNVLAGMLNITGTLANTAITVSSAAILAGTGTTAGTISFQSGSKFLFNAASPLNVGGAVTFADPSNFSIADIVGLTSSVAEGIYTLIAGTVDTTGLANLGSGNAYDLGSGKSAYFQSGSLQVVVVPEPSVCIAALSGLVTFTIARHRWLASKPARPLPAD